MKTLYFIFSLLTLFTFAQEPIIVNITGDCSTVSGTYYFTGLINGKNNYATEFNIDGEATELEIGFDGVKWVLYMDDDLTDYGFFNTNVPNSELPPNIGWQLNFCESGTLIIQGGVATNPDVIFEQNFKVYQTSSNYLKFDLENLLTNKSINVAIINILGRTILSTKIENHQQIDISSLIKGIYLVRINNLVKKIIIQ